MHPGGGGDEHVEGGRQQDGGAEHSAETSGFGGIIAPGPNGPGGNRSKHLLCLRIKVGEMVRKPV